MSNPEEANSCVPDTQETYYEGANESFKIISETQNMSLNESQDFRLVDSGEDESIVEKMKQTQDGEANSQKSVEQMDPQQTPTPSRSEVDDNTITVSDQKNETIVNENVIENKTIEKTEENISNELRESEKKDELFDEDDVIQGTPPSYSPSRKVSSVDITSLKRKARTVDEPPAKIARTMEDITSVKKQLEGEESRQSYESDDSYQDLFRNIDKNVIIEETQDPTNLELTQNSLRIPVKHATETTDNDKAREHYAEHINQQRDETFSEKCCDTEKDENLNVSAKLTDTSANDSTVVINSTSENDSQLEDNNLSIETKGDVASTSVVITDKKSGIGTLDKTKSIRDTETMLDENNQVEQSNCIKPIEKIVSDNDKEISASQTKSRISIELIYESANLTVDDSKSRSKPQVVQIDDDGEKIVLDSSTEMIYDAQGIKTRSEVVQIDDSHEDGEKIVINSLGKNSEVRAMDKSSCESKSGTDLSYRSMESMKESSLDSKLTADKKLINGSTESKRSDTDATVSLDSDTFSGCDEQILSAAVIIAAHKKRDSTKSNSFVSKDVDNNEFISISDNETSNVEEKNKSDLNCNSMTKTAQVEREIGMCINLKLKCLMHVDESTKEPVSKELTAVQCEIIDSIVGKQKNEDSQSSLADISDNKDSSPGSVNSNPHLYQLNPSRLSIMSSISSSSSSSAASLAMKLAIKGGVHSFSIPVGPAKHAKKSSQDALLTATDKQMLDETYDRLTREWNFNHRLLTTTILNHANAELGNIMTATATTTATTIIDTFANVSNERLDDHHHHHHHHLEKNNIRSSTPSDQPTTRTVELNVTPKSTKKSKNVKRPRSKLARSNIAQINGENSADNADNVANEPTLHTSATETDTPSSRKKRKTENTGDRLLSDTYIPANSSLRNILVDELIGKNVFAKWSGDNIYYPGMVSARLKNKYKVNFCDGKSKTLIPEFVIPIPKILREGLSVYATTKTNDYGFCGIIVDAHTLDDDDDAYYTVETDEGERLRVQVQDIFLSADQAQVLKEEMNSTDKSSLPSTPKALNQVTLDNVVDGKRRSKRNGTPLFSTPKSRGNVGTSTSASKTKSEPSVSGMSAKLKKEKGLLENESMSSDSNVESAQTEDKDVLRGVQKEIIGTPYEQITKGSQNRIKSKSRSKKKEEDPQVIATLGPIPTNSELFKGKSFILTCVSLDTLERYLDPKIPAVSDTETEATETDVETENEDAWVNRPFVRHRLHSQILAGGGKIYEDFRQIPKDEYKDTILITNVPNTTAKSILCLSAGISACNHEYIIRSCAENKIMSKAAYTLPNGWSLQKKAYIDRTSQTSGNKPLSTVIVIIPSLTYDEQFATFWQQVCENAGAVVLIAENSGAMETMDFDSNVVVVSNHKCPSWAIDRATRLQIPVLSTTWVVQCIIEGKLCLQDQHPRYKYNYKLESFR